MENAVKQGFRRQKKIVKNVSWQAVLQQHTSTETEEVKNGQREIYSLEAFS